MPLRLLHTADLHLDWLFEKFSPEAREKRRREVLDRFSRIVDLALEREVAAVLMAGDVFHGEAVAESTFHFFRHQLERLNAKNIWALITPGNHDPLEDNSYWSRRSFPARTKVFASPDWECFSALDGVEVWGLPFIPSRRGERVLAKLPAGGTTAVRLALVHGQVLDGQGEEDYYPVAEADLAGCGLSCLALGHVHRPRNFFWGETRVIYPGSPVRLTFKETEPRGVEILTIHEGRVETERVELPDREFRVVELDLNRQGPEGIYQALSQLADRELCLKTVLTGVAGEEAEFLGDGLARDFSDRFFHLEVEDKTVFLDGGQADGNTVKGLFLRKIAERFADPDLTEEERLTVKYALHYGLSALKGVGRR